MISNLIIQKMPTLNKPKKKRQYQNIDKRKIRQDIYRTQTWQRLRLAYIIQHPLDEIDLINGKYTPAIDVHHIVSFVNISDQNTRKDVAFNPLNLLALSKENHAKIHNDKEFRQQWTHYFINKRGITYV